jgi:hypothetical protein
VFEHADELLPSHLEADQVSDVAERPLPPAQLSHGAVIALGALRVAVVVLGAMVIYTFVAQLGS